MGKASQLKAIETEYAGYRFRSRQEARWAVWLDKMGVAWLYEWEGFDLGDGLWYLPDFWLPEIPSLAGGPEGWWIEVKGKFPTDEEMEKAAKLAQQSDNGVAIVWSNFSEESARNELAFYKDASGVFHSKQGDIMAQILARTNKPGLSSWLAMNRTKRKMCKADKAARSARFRT